MLDTRSRPSEINPSLLKVSRPYQPLWTLSHVRLKHS
jgi:hypothetical protein